MAIKLTPVEVIKEDQKISTFEFNGSLVTPKRIEQIIEINFPGNKAGRVTKYRLPSDVTTHLLVKAFTLDITNDDDDKLQEANFHVGSIPIVFFLYDIARQKIVRRLSTSFVGYPLADFYLVFDASLEIQVKCSTEFTSLTFYCEPIHVCHRINAEVQ